MYAICVKDITANVKLTQNTEIIRRIYIYIILVCKKVTKMCSVF